MMDFPGVICGCGCKDSDHYEMCGTLCCKNCIPKRTIDTGDKQQLVFGYTIKTVQANYKGIILTCCVQIK